MFSVQVGKFQQLRSIGLGETAVFYSPTVLRDVIIFQAIWSPERYREKESIGYE
jgi:hypothetical protein